jgi:hypothetical protein
MDYLSSGNSKGKKNATSGEDSNEGKPLGAGSFSLHILNAFVK